MTDLLIFWPNLIILVVMARLALYPQRTRKVSLEVLASGRWFPKTFRLSLL